MTHLNADTLPCASPHTTTGEARENSRQDSRMPALCVITGLTVDRSKSQI